MQCIGKVLRSLDFSHILLRYSLIPSGYRGTPSVCRRNSLRGALTRPLPDGGADASTSPGPANFERCVSCLLA